FLLLVLSVVPWRSDSIFDGGVDPLDVGKALVALTAFFGAGGLVLGTKERVPIGIAPASVITMILMVSLLGAIVAGNETATFVVVARVLIAMATLLLVLSAIPWNVGVASLL